MVRKVKGASRLQYGFIACEEEMKKSDKYVAVRARKSGMNVSRRGFSRSAKMWHRYTNGGIPICDVCKRVGHVARSCWQKKKSVLGRHVGCRENSGCVVHSVVMNRVFDSEVDRYLEVSVNGQHVDALMDFNATENAVSLETVEVFPKLKIYELEEDVGASSRKRLGALGMVWLPVVIGSRSDKLRCVVVEGLTEKLIIGLPGLSFLGVNVDFATGDVRIRSRRKKKLEEKASAKKRDELHEDHALVREAKIECKKSKDIMKCAVLSEMSPESRHECIKKPSVDQVKDDHRNDGLHDDVRGKDRHKTPNQKKEEKNPVSGRGRKKEEVNVVSPKQEMLTTITLDHNDETSEGECDRVEEDVDEQEELEQCSSESTEEGKQTSKVKCKKGKKSKKKSKKNKKKNKR